MFHSVVLEPLRITHALQQERTGATLYPDRETGPFLALSKIPLLTTHSLTLALNLTSILTSGLTPILNRVLLLRVYTKVQD